MPKPQAVPEQSKSAPPDCTRRQFVVDVLRKTTPRPVTASLMAAGLATVASAAGVDNEPGQTRLSDGQKERTGKLAVILTEGIAGRYLGKKLTTYLDKLVVEGNSPKRIPHPLDDAPMHESPPAVKNGNFR